MHATYTLNTRRLACACTRAHTHACVKFNMSGTVQGIMPDQWNPCSGISDLYQLLACTFTPYRCWASLKRSLLDMPTKQQYHPEVRQQVG